MTFLFSWNIALQNRLDFTLGHIEAKFLVNVIWDHYKIMTMITKKINHFLDSFSYKFRIISNRIKDRFKQRLARKIFPQCAFRLCVKSCGSMISSLRIASFEVTFFCSAGLNHYLDNSTYSVNPGFSESHYSNEYWKTCSYRILIYFGFFLWYFFTT